MEFGLLTLLVINVFDENRKMWRLDSLSEEKLIMPFSFNYGGRPYASIIKKHKYYSEKLDENRVKHIAVYSDTDTGLEITSESISYNDFSAIEWVLYIKNNGSSDTEILENILPLDISFSKEIEDGSPYKLHYAKGALCCIDDFAPLEKVFKEGDSLHLQPGGGRSSSEYMPFFNIDFGNKGYIIAIGWTGEWSADFLCKDDKLQVKAGMAETHLKLHPSEQIRTPRILLLHWNGEHIQGNNLLRRFMLSHHRPKPNNEPLILPVILSDWGGMPVEHHLKNIERIIKNKLPIGLYWIDAEWFGQKPWYENVGNWAVRKDIYPNGFKPISDMLHKHGMKFLLWFEPQRVCKGTPWYNLKENPGWLLELGNGTPEFKQRDINWHISHEDPRWIIYESRRNQIAEDDMLFNIGNPDARNFLTNFLSEKIIEFGLDWYREDFNIAPLEYWQNADPPDRQGMTEIRYIEGLYTLWDELLKRHPHLMIDNCASGGRRIDLETISRSTALWRTDWPADSIHKQCHSYGLFQWVPLNMTAGAILNKGNEYNLRSSMTSGLMVQLWEGDDEDKVRYGKALIEQYLQIQKYFYGDFYPLTEYSKDNDVWMAWQFNCPETGDGMIQAFRRENSSNDTETYKLKGLDVNAKYYLKNVDDNSSTEMTAEELIKHGLKIIIKEKPGSAIFIYNKISQ